MLGSQDNQGQEFSGAPSADERASEKREEQVERLRGIRVLAHRQEVRWYLRAMHKSPATAS